MGTESCVNREESIIGKGKSKYKGSELHVLVALKTSKWPVARLAGGR